MNLKFKLIFYYKFEFYLFVLKDFALRLQYDTEKCWL